MVYKSTKKIKIKPKNATRKVRTRQIYKENYNINQKIKLANRIRDISEDELLIDYNKLVEEGNKMNNVDKYERSDFSRIGNKAVDYFTFSERLNTKGPKKLSFYELWNNKPEFQRKPFVQKLIHHTYTTTGSLKSEIQQYYKMFNLYYGSIYIFKPTTALDIYHRFRPKCVLDMTMGWGGRLMGACALNVPRYIGIDNNLNLKEPYNKMRKFLKGKTQTKMNLIFKDALTIDYKSLKHKYHYDMVFTSPPYFNIEQYGNSQTNPKYINKEDWYNNFYSPLIQNTFEHLAIGGHYCLNVQVEIYENVCVKHLGKADIKIPLNLVERGNNEYKEFIYVWIK